MATAQTILNCYRIFPGKISQVLQIPLAKKECTYYDKSVTRIIQAPFGQRIKNYVLRQPCSSGLNSNKIILRLSMNKQTKICILITMLLLAAGIAGSIFIFRHTSDQCTAHIYQDGQLIETIDLNKVTEPYTFEITDADGHSNTVEVRHGEIGITAASCPDKVCVNMGFIKNDMLPVTCLPNRLVIKIESGSVIPEESFDALSH